MVSTRTRTSGCSCDDSAGWRSSPSRIRHPDVHQHHVRSRPSHLPYRSLAIGGLCHDLEVQLPVEDPRKADTHHVLVVRDHHSAHAPAPSGIVTWSRKPSMVGPALTRPPYALTRSVIASRP